jgi:hypothetical protein
MANNWGIPYELEKEVRRRDKYCVYCSIELKEHPLRKGTPGDKATFEHIDNDGLPSEQNIAMCCASCNASKGIKRLLDWFNTAYCKEKNINETTVAGIVKRYIANNRPH